MYNYTTKNILIGGVARAGKSTISERLSKNNRYNHIPVDYIATSFQHNFPDCGINNRVIIDEGSIKLSLFLSTIMEKINETNEKFIVDSAHIMPKDIVPYIDQKKWDVYFVGYPNISAQVKFEQIRKYDAKNAWTRRQEDKEMFKIVERIDREKQTNSRTM